MQSSKISSTFMFLTKLAWNSRLTLPTLITAVFLALNFRWEVEINIHSERIVFQEEDGDSDDSAELSTDEYSDDEDSNASGSEIEYYS